MSENIGYPTVKCFHPRVVMNKYTGDLIEVGCGVCKACVLQKSRKMSFLCSLEENEHKYCMFVTLTYSNDYAPIMHPEIDEEKGIIRWISDCERLDEQGQLKAIDYSCNHQSMSLKGYLALLTEKCKLDGNLTYVSKRDVQLFMKRLRKRLSKYTDEKIRYYATSEYGPKTFRAHYHLLLFYDKTETQKVMSNAVRSCWKFGRVDCSLSRGKCNSYVARYVNSSYSLPFFLGDMSCKPFSLHSWYFAQGLYRSQKEIIYENDLDDFVQLSGEVGSRYVEFMPWRSLACTFFPKCKGYNSKSDSELWRSYNILQEVRRVFGKAFNKLTFPQIAENLIDRIWSFLYDNTYVPKSHYEPEFQRLAFYFEEYVPRIAYEEEVYERNKNALIREMYISRHFLSFVCDNETYHERWRKFCMIKEFWKRYDYKMLVSMYQSQIDNEKLCDDYSFYYLNSRAGMDYEHLNKQKFYQRFVMKTNEDFDKSIKHKKLNDMNKFLVYG